MKTKMKYIIYIICFFWGVTACDDFLDHPLPGAVSDDNIGDIIAYNPDQIASFLGDAYRKYAAVYSREIHIALGSLSHELDLDYISTEARNEFSRNDVTSANKYLGVDYRPTYYKALSSVNLTLDLISNHIDSEELSESDMTKINNYKGEALFLRALVHFDLLRLFGENGPNFGGTYPNNKDAKGIVLANRLITADDPYSARSTVEECYNFIITDLKNAAELIGDNQIPANTIVRTPGSADDDYTLNTGWAQKPAVYALLGKVYLYMNNYSNAEKELAKVISDSRFALDRSVNFSDYIQHTDNNAESIFSLQYYDYDGPTDAYPPYHQINRMFSNVPGGWKNFFIDQRTAVRFGDDPRIYELSLYDYTWENWSTTISPPVWIQADTNASDFRYYPRKHIDFFDVSTPQYSTKNYCMLRLADIYLMYAEANFNLGNTGIATEYTNKVRRRAWDETDYNSPATKGEDLSTVDMQTIQEERYKELFFEGHRWFDICRWGIVEEELSKYPTTKAGVVHYDDHDYYMPAPESELKSNPLLEQSLGY
nr:RagB/SusD family nutrient uptake outer membrane protein [uncultured Draconibacterium sp.]